MKDLYKFEKNLKKKLDEQEFPFDEKNWEKASAMIDASRSNRKPFMFFMLSAVALLITSSAIYYFVSSSNDKPENLLAINTEASNIKESSVNSNSDNSPVTTITEATPIAAITEAVENTNNSVSNSNAGSQSVIKKTTLSSQTSKSVAHLTSTSKTEAVNANSNLNSKTSEAKPSSNAALKNTTSTPFKSNNGTETNKTSPVKNSTVKEIPIILGNNVTAQPVKSIEGNNASSVSGNTNRLGTDNTTTTPVITKTNTSVLTDSLIDVKTVVSSTLVVNAGDSIAATPILISDSSSNSATNMSIAAPYQVKHTKNSIYAEVGTTYLLGWNTNGVQEAHGFNIVAGLNYVHYFNTHVSLGAGVQYNTINNLSQSTYSVSRVNYDFGVSKEVTEIKYLQLHFITIPIKLGFNIGKNNIIGLGGNFATLLNSDCRTDKYRTNNAEPLSEKNQLSTKKEKGYLTGFKAYDIQASVFYRRKLIKGFSVNAEFIYGFTDIKNNSHFNTTNFERSMGGKITLCYDLFKK